jgi:hypothetical protein
MLYTHFWVSFRYINSDFIECTLDRTHVFERGVTLHGYSEFVLLAAAFFID